MTPQEREEHRRIHAEAEGVNRADRGLRRFGRQVGEATMCPECDGGGYVCRGLWERPQPINDHVGRTIVQPVQCPTCKGEGLDPKVRHGGRW